MFNNILTAFSLKKNPKDVLGIDIGSSAIKIVHLMREGERAVLKNYGEVSLGPYAGGVVGQATNLSPEKISTAIKDLLVEAKFEITNGGMAIPVGSSLLSFIEVPSRDKRKLEKLIPIEARKHIPIPINEVALDWWVLPVKGEGSVQETSKNIKKTKEKKEMTTETSEVVVSAIHNETINKYKKIQEESRLKIDLFEIEIFSGVRSVIGRDRTPVMVLDLGAVSTKLSLVNYGVIKSYHVINKGGQHITTAFASSMETTKEEAEKNKRKVGLSGKINNVSTAKIAGASLGYIFSEASNAVVNFEQKKDIIIKKVILTGGGSLLKGLPEVAQKYFKAEVVLGHPFERVEYPAFLDEVLKQTGPEFAVSVGIALKTLQRS